MPTSAQALSVPVELFGVCHLAALGVIAVATAALIVPLRLTRAGHNGPRLRRVVCGSLAVLLMGNVVYAEIYWIVTGTWTVGRSLPLQLCDLAHFVTAAALYAAGRGNLEMPKDLRERSRWNTIFELSYYWGVCGTSQALLTPDLPVSFPHPEFVRFFMGHGAIVAGVLVLAIGVGVRPRPGSAVRVWLMTNALVPPIMLFNWLAGTNYMFLMGPPKNNPSLMTVFGPWPWSLFSLEIAALVLMLASYSPFWILNRLGQRRCAVPGMGGDPNAATVRRSVDE